MIRDRLKRAENIWEFVLWMPSGYEEPAPGQFIRVKCDNALLPRPFSVSWSDKEGSSLSIVVEAKGLATNWLTSQPYGATLDISKPLGKGFDLKNEKKYLVVGGGIGVAPLSSVFGHGRKVDSILCFQSMNKVLRLPKYGTSGEKVIIATDDGSFGVKGRADEILCNYLSSGHLDYEAILTCGPKPMLSAVAKIADEFNIPCQVSLEERMACSVGECKGCAVQLVDRKGTVCKDGPVFNAKEVRWDA